MRILSLGFAPIDKKSLVPIEMQLQTDLLLIERGRYKSIGFLFIHLGDIPRRYPLSAVRAENSSVVEKSIEPLMILSLYIFTKLLSPTF